MDGGGDCCEDVAPLLPPFGESWPAALISGDGCDDVAPLQPPVGESFRLAKVGT